MSSTDRRSTRQSLGGNLLLGLAVTILFVGGLEGLARLVADEPTAAPEVEDYIWDWEERWDGDFYTIRSAGVGWPPWEEFNGDGLRDRSHAVEKPEGVARLICLGDSVTLGGGIEPQQAFPQVLQERLDAQGPGVEVFNLALWGWSTRQQRIAYRRIARKYGPDHVLLGVCLNDIPELQNNLARPPRWLSVLHERSALVRWIVDAPGREIRSVEELFENSDSSRVREAFERFSVELLALRDEVAADDAQLVVTVFPFRFQLTADAPVPTVQRRIADLCASAGITCLDLLPELKAAGDEVFRDYDHLSPHGAQVVAEALQRSGLLPAPIPATRLLAEDGQLPEVAAWISGRRPDPVTAADGLGGALAADDPELRRAAAWAAWRLGPAVPGLLESLTNALGDPEERVRAEAARALGELGERGRPAIPRLFDALDDPRQSVRWAAAHSLWRLRPSAPEAVAPLAEALRSEDAFVRGFAAWTLGTLGPAAGGAVPDLIEALEREGGYDRAGAANALARLGAAARDAIPSLVRGLNGPDQDRRWKAARALGRIGLASDGSLEALAGALEDSNERVRFHAARALGRIGRAASPASDALAKATRDPDETVREEALRALDRISSSSP